ncbi:MAG TPA: Ig-like domain-containing protein, partial [Candidatus Limnocylindria bacterium]|nr:Ig-like domain-containing protein [Candidatus Limnocylindria bacterium]
DGAAPFSAVWSNVIGGSHRLTASGLDAGGNSYVATPVNIGVASALIASNSVWKYLDDGSDQGTNWVALDFDDSTWASGPAPLGYSDSNGRAPVTTNSFGPDANAKFTTTYYRQSFVVADTDSFANVTLNLQRDDGAVLYLNGAEIGRFNMPGGTVTYATFASQNAGDDGGTTFTMTVSPSSLREGVNVLAAEIHQDAGSSSDIWFVMDLNAVPFVIHNLFPTIAITNPTNDQFFVAPASITIEATASDADGSVTNVEFFYGGVKIGESANSPYSIVWNNPPVGAHVITAVASDNENGKGSAQIPIVVYDAASRPVVAIVSPANGAIMEGPTNLTLTAAAQALTGITNVQFFANGEFIGQDATEPYTVVWPSTFLSNGLSAVAFDATGVSGTSHVVSVTITIPPTNTVAPTLVTQFPLAFSTVTNLTNITVRFSELVLNVDAGDLLINGAPATGVTGSRSNYTFSFPHPPYGKVEVTFANGHGITDYGYPENLPFVETTWEYDLIDRTIPTIASRFPATNAFVTNLTEVAVTFSEVVTNVDATDLLVNGTPGFALSGSGSSYTFSVIQPSSGTVNFTWATTHGILDTASNAFNRTGAGSTWSVTLDSRTTLAASNSTWRFIKGLAEASDPTNAWRQIGFDDSSWNNAAAPFFYGDPYTNAAITGTLLSDMRSNYSSIYLRKEFTIVNRSSVTNLILRAQSDDGFIAWINGVQVQRYNAPNAALGEVPFSGVASASAGEPNNAGAAYIQYNLSLASLVTGTNVLAVHALNNNLNTDTDFGFNANLYTFLSDASISPPRVAFSAPVQGDVFALTSVTITFSESVANVDAEDLIVNGVPAAGTSSTTNTIYTFSFPQPAYGTVNITWAAGHGIVDFDTPVKAFDGNAASARLTYTLVNPSAPTIIVRAPVPSATVTGLTSITIMFSEPVTGVDASDLLVSGAAASDVSALSSTNYLFTFAQPPFGTVTVRWATNHGIQDLELPANDFAPARPGHTWDYNLIDPVPAVAITAPANNSFVLEPANILVRATATDSDGMIALVEFYEGASKIGEATGSSPYSITWSNISLGTYTFRAVATDNTGLIGTSAPVVINVVTSLPIVLVRGPYLLNGSPTGGMVRWRTDQFSDGVVRYGTNLENLANVALETTLTNNHIVWIGGLQPDTKYYYSIGSGSHTIAGGTNAGGSNFWFTTSPLAGTPKPTRFWVLGDAGTANANQRAVRDSFYNYAATNNRPADLWLMLGDNAYNVGSDTEHQAAVFDMYPSTLRNLFLWPVLGNHESSQSYTAAQFPYLDIFTTSKNGEAGGIPSGNGKYYSFDYGNIHFVGLDSMTSTRSATSPMAEWLKDDLAANTQTWTVVYFHHPPYTKGSHNSDAETDLIEVRQNINPILETYGVDLVLSGHSHCYERSYLLNGHYGLSTTLNTNTMFVDGGNGREEDTGAYQKSMGAEGTIYSVAGSSGQATGGTLNHPAHFISLNELGSVIIDVVSNRLDMKFLNSSGVERDHLTLLKREPVFAPIGLVINGGGGVSGATNGELLQIGQTYTLVATPESGSVFTSWSGDAASTESTLSFIMQSNLVIVVNFAPIGTAQFDRLTLAVQGNGSVAGAANGQLLEIGQSYTITAIPGDGSVFANWSGGAASALPALTFVMRSNLVLIAHFVEQGGGGSPFEPNQLTLIINGNGAVNGATNGQFLQIGSNYTLVATAGAGSVFANWSGGVSESSSTLNFIMQPNLVIVANFVEQGGP